MSPEGNLDNATFYCLQTAQEAEQWAKETCVVVKDGRSVESVEVACKQQGIDSPGRRAVIYLILNPRLGSIGFVINCSHVLSGHHALQVMETFAEQLANDSTGKGLSKTFTREDLDIALQRLPRSAIAAYEEKFKPTSFEIEKAWKTQAMAAERYSKVSSFSFIYFPFIKLKKKKEIKEQKRRKSIARDYLSYLLIFFFFFFTLTILHLHIFFVFFSVKTFLENNWSTLSQGLAN